MIPSDPDDLDVLAGEYVLGLLDSATAAEVEANLASEPLLAERVQFWEDKLFPLSGARIPAMVDPNLWARIERDLAAPRGERVASALRANSSRRPLVARVWRSTPFWRAATALATAAAILFAILPLRYSELADPATRYFAILQTRNDAGAETGPGWLIRIGQDGTVRSVPLGEIDPGRGRALQLWTLWDQARGPVSLGVLPPGGSVRLPADSLPVIANGQLFEITLEPETGSPTGRPTGRILFIGRASPGVSATL